MTDSLRRLLAVFCLSFSTVALADDLKAFPPAQSGMQRYVIRVPAVDAPDERKVEVLIGKRMEVDCNRPRFGATVEEKIAKGWGYSYYEVSKLAGPVSTLMACPPGEAKTPAFVQAHTPALAALRYNPRLPLVIYAPEGIEVQYRIWSAGAAQPVTKPE